MLDSLEIINFRSLKNLKINRLGSITLFTGKNNTGKSTILEAIALYATKGDPTFIYQLLGERGENFKQEGKDTIEVNLRSLSSMFTNRTTGFTEKDSLTIGAIEQTLFGEQVSKQEFLSIRFVKYYDEVVKEDSESTTGLRKRIIIGENDTKELFVDFLIGLEIKSAQGAFILPLHRDKPYRFTSSRILSPTNSLQFIRTRNIDREINGKLWDYIALTEKEEYVIRALQLIEPNIERVTFIDDSRDRTAVVKLKGDNTVVPLKSMGDGINRIITIILALVNAENGFLLVDEFENGLHYTIQEKLWEIVFNIAKRMNIQIFATTHSDDCIMGFEKALNKRDNNLSGQLVRLDLKDGAVVQVEFNAEELKIANDQKIETR